jgi:2'-5' RNA ligase superfamily protein
MKRKIDGKGVDKRACHKSGVARRHGYTVRSLDGDRLSWPGGAAVTAPSQTGLIVAVPEAEPVVGAHRAALDPIASWGIPAHVTVLYPFLPPPAIDDAVLTKLGALFAALPAFEAALSRVSWFGSEVLWLAPEPGEPFRHLTGAVGDRFPSVLPYGGLFDDVVPHLTVGDRAPLAALSAAAADIDPRLPIRMSVRSVRLVEGTTGAVPWRTVAEFPLAAV